MLVFTESSRGPDDNIVQSNKYYNGKITEVNGKWIAECSWGRIGAAKGQSLKKEFFAKYEAKYFIEDKFSEKKKKGYKEVEDSVYKTMVATAQFIGLNNKIISTRWLERLNDKWTEVKDELRLQEPNCFPGLEVIFDERSGETHKFLFASDATFVSIVKKNDPLDFVRTDNFFKISNSHPLSSVADKVHAAIFSVG